MIDAFARGDDIHSITASQVFGVPLEAVTQDLRKKAKAVNFGIVYGISAFSLSQERAKQSARAESRRMRSVFIGRNAFAGNPRNMPQPHRPEYAAGRRRH